MVFRNWKHDIAMGAIQVACSFSAVAWFAWMFIIWC